MNKYTAIEAVEYTAESMLRQHAEMWASLGSTVPYYSWLLEQGEVFGPAIRIRGFPLGEIKQCYRNSFNTLMRLEDWHYTEGVVLGPKVPILISHAWLSNRKGEVLDLTLRCQKKATYFGIPFKREFVISETLRLEHYGIVDTGYGYNREIVGKKLGHKRAWRKRK